MVSFTPLTKWKTTKVITNEQIDSSGYSTQTKTYRKYYEDKRDFFSLGEMREELPIVYYLHHFLGLICPVVLIA